MFIKNDTLVTLAADIVMAHVSNNTVALNDVDGLIKTVYSALETLGVATEPVQEKPKGLVSVRSSIKPDYIISMIDGKGYKMLKRHIALNGYTPESYREAFDLPKDYPMVCAAYVAKRREIAVKAGLGRKSAPEPIAPPKAPRKPRAKKAVRENLEA